MEENLKIEKSQIRTMRTDLIDAEKQALKKIQEQQTRPFEPLPITPQVAENTPVNQPASFATTNQNPPQQTPNTQASYQQQQTQNIQFVKPQQKMPPTPLVKDDLGQEEKKKIAREAQEKLVAAREKALKEEQERIINERLAKERAEREKLERERLERERLEREQEEREKLEKERLERELEKERLAREKLEKEKEEKERLERERLEK
ncbi:MAG: hypothetical protein PHW52_02680, partial [Candidatus Pacebacteria bacterium]|nr:hypothetical protein [Candidatus Paceibacterota bacterium]